MPDFHSYKRALRDPWIVVPALIFLGISLLLLMALPESNHSVPDSLTYLLPAQQVAAGQAPLFGYRFPGYPLLVGAFLKVFGSLKVVYAAQTLMHLLFAWWGVALYRRLRGEAPPYTFTLILLFPSFVYAQLLIPDVPFAMLYLGATLAMLTACQEQRPGMAVLGGIALGLAAILRGNAPFLVLALVAGVLVLAWLPQSGKRLWKTSGLVLLLVIPFLIGVATVMVVNQSEDGRLAYMNPDYRRYTMHDHIIYAEFLRERQSFEEARAKVYERTRVFEGLDEAQWQALPRLDIYKRVLDHTARHLIGMGLGTLLRVMTLAEVRMLISNAQREWLELAGMRALNMREAFQLEKIREAPLSALIMHALFAIALAVRILAFMGLWRVIRERDYSFLAITFIPIVVIFFFSGFIGYSRYRLPVEPFLLMYTVIGIETIRSFWLSRGGRSS